MSDVKIFSSINTLVIIFCIIVPGLIVYRSDLSVKHWSTTIILSFIVSVILLLFDIYSLIEEKKMRGIKLFTLVVVALAIAYEIFMMFALYLSRHFNWH